MRMDKKRCPGALFRGPCRAPGLVRLRLTGETFPRWGKVPRRSGADEGLGSPLAGELSAARRTEGDRSQGLRPWGTLFPTPFLLAVTAQGYHPCHPSRPFHGLRRVTFCSRKKSPKTRLGGVVPDEAPAKGRPGSIVPAPPKNPRFLRGPRIGWCSVLFPALG